MSSISICLYVKNHEDLIIDWLSTFNEVDTSAIELVIVDDGSTDETLLKIQSFSLQYQGKIKLIMTPSIGGLQAINKAISFMHGDFYSFLSIYDTLDSEYLVSLPKMLNSSAKIYGLYPSLQEERILNKQTLLCFLPHLSSYIFHRDVVNQIEDCQLHENERFDILYQLTLQEQEIICLPSAYIKVKRNSFSIDQESFDYFKGLYDQGEDTSFIIILMIHHLLIRGISKKIDNKKLYDLQKQIKEIEPKYLKNKYLTLYDEKQLKQLKYLKYHLFFLIK